jgi:hypothetical protein
MLKSMECKKILFGNNLISDIIHILNLLLYINKFINIPIFYLIY